MHETVVAESLLEAILAEAEKQRARPVAAKVSCGTLNALNDEVVSFAFEAIASQTVCESMKLIIEHKPMQGRCGHCNRTFSLTMTDLRCSYCGRDDFEVLPDAPILLEEIEFEKD